MEPRALRSRHAGAWALAFVAAAGLTVSVADALGGTGLDGTGLGVAGASVEPCATGAMRVSMDLAYLASIRGYVVVGASVTGVPARCDGSALRVTFSGLEGVQLAEATAVGRSPFTRIDLPSGLVVPANDVSSVAIVLSS